MHKLVAFWMARLDDGGMRNLPMSNTVYFNLCNRFYFAAETHAEGVEIFEALGLIRDLCNE